MLSKLKYLFTYLVWCVTCSPSYIAFRVNVKDVESTQRNLLSRIIKTNRLSTFGQEHNFSNIFSVADFQKYVPLSTYEDYIEFIERMNSGEVNTLTTDKVTFLQPSSGSTNPSKYLPFTTSLRKQFRLGIKAWLFNLMWSRPSLVLGRSYWSITPAHITHLTNERQGKLPINFDDDVNYLGVIDKLALLITGVMPNSIGRITNQDNFKYATLLFLVREKNLRLLSIWSPTFLLLLMEDIESNITQLILDIENGSLTFPSPCDQILSNKLACNIRPMYKRADELRSIWTNNNLSLADKLALTWPDMKLISAWADASSTHSINAVKVLFPGIEIQPKGLIATEAFISFPHFTNRLSNSESVLAVGSHFYEFLEHKENADPKPRLAHELKTGEKYSLVITTAGGLYRYQLQDIVEVTGHFKQAPTLRFCGKLDHISDMTGEKINAQHVSEILTKITKEYKLSVSFQLLAPERCDNAFNYTLFLATNSSDPDYAKLVKDLDSELSSNYHYRYCRSLGQLKLPRIFRIDTELCSPHIVLLKHRSKTTKIGDIKPSCLDSNLYWSHRLPGKYVASDSITS